MENNQSKQQSSSELNASRLARLSDGEVTPPVGSNFRKNRLLDYPGLILGGIWLLLIAFAAIAGFNLANIGHVEKEKLTTAPVTVQQPAQKSSLWLLSAVALTFAAGSLAVSKRLSSLRSRRLRQSAQRAVPIPTSLREQRRTLPRTLASTLVEPVPDQTEPVPTPPQENQLLAIGSESLAEMMDIRKQHSLDSILRKL